MCVYVWCVCMYVIDSTMSGIKSPTAVNDAFELRWELYWSLHYTYIAAASDGERILKIGQHLAKLWAREREREREFYSQLNCRHTRRAISPSKLVPILSIHIMNNIQKKTYRVRRHFFTFGVCISFHKILQKKNKRTHLALVYL